MSDDAVYGPKIDPADLANAIVRFLEPRFQPWFIAGTTNLNELRESYDEEIPLPYPSVGQRQTLLQARETLDQLGVQEGRPVGEERERVLNGLFATLSEFVPTDPTGTMRSPELTGLETVLNQAKFVDPTEDPLGRGALTPGFGYGSTLAEPPAPLEFPPEFQSPQFMDYQRGQIVAAPGDRYGYDTTTGRPVDMATGLATLGQRTQGTAGPGGQWVYSTLTNRPEFVKEGETFPERTYELPKAAGLTELDATEAEEAAQEATDSIEETGQDPADETTTDDPAVTGGVPGADVDPGDGGEYDTTIPEDWKRAASEIYGAYYSIVSQNPEVANLIARAEAQKWGPEKFDYELEQTQWWKTHSLATRTFDIEMQRDPATVQARIDALAAQIRDDALNLNIRLGGETLNTIATEAIRQGWTEQQVTIAIGDEALKSQAGVTGLRYGYYGNKINEIAASYGVSISDTEFSQLVNKFAVGQENQESLTAAFQTRSSALFPALSERLMAGETFANIVEPYRNRASKILEQDFSASDFMDNDSFAQAVTYVGDDGKQRPMTYTEWGQYLRSNREFGYEYTSEAQSRAYQVANRIADIFGAI